jgi:hypothetical protein
MNEVIPATPGTPPIKPPGAIDRWVVWGILLLLPLIYFFPAVFGQKLLAIGDGWSYSLQLRILIGRMIAQGIWPLWNSHIFAGSPLLASIQPGALYPPNWLFAVLSPIAAMNAVVILTYHLALIGSYLYVRRIGVGRAGAVIAGTIFAFGGFMISHLDQVNYVAALAWLPWVLFAVEKIHQSKSRRELWGAVCLGAAVIAFHLFAGLPQATFQIAIVAGLYFFFTLLVRVEEGNRLRFVCGIGFMALCGTLLSMVQLLPAMELQRQGERFIISYDYFSMMSMPARRLFSLVFPYFFGGGYGPLYRVGGWDHWWLVKWSFAYAGMIGLLLAIASFTEIRRNRIVCFWAGMAALALFLCFGSYLPFELNRLLYKIPVYRLFRGSYRHLLEFNFTIAVLAGFGMDAIRRAEGAAARRVFRWSAILLSIFVIGTAVMYRFLENRFASESPPPPNAHFLTNPEALAPMVFFLLSIAAVWGHARWRSRWSTAILTSVLLLDLASFGWYSHWRTIDSSLFARLSDPPVVQAIKDRDRDFSTFRVISHSESSIGVDLEAVNHQNLSIIRGLQSVNGYDPMRISRFAPLAGGMDISGVVTDRKTFGLLDQGLNLLNVKYLIFEHRTPLSSENFSPPAERWRSIANFGAITLYENTKSEPRAWIAKAKLALPEQEILRVIKEGSFSDGRTFNPEEYALVETTAPIDQRANPPGGAASHVTIESYEPQRIRLSARCENSGYLVLSEIYYPGWEAWVDGVLTPVERVNYALRGLSLPAGDHQVTFMFRSRSIRHGLWVSALGVLILLIGAVLCRRPEKT